MLDISKTLQDLTSWYTAIRYTKDQKINVLNYFRNWQVLDLYKANPDLAVWLNVIGKSQNPRSDWNMFKLIESLTLK